jgi:DNA invertase Pin-like site-specific DNA recombinase
VWNATKTAAEYAGQFRVQPTVMDPNKLAAATARLARGESPTHIAKALGVSRATLYRHADVVTARGQS